MSKLKMKEIADRINAHLNRIEADPELNPNRLYNRETRQWEETGDPKKGYAVFWHANARYHGAGPRMYVVYNQTHGTHTLTKAEGVAYLEWLDAGNVGTHYDVEKEDNAEK